jgi:uncharacterized protein YndB with AHSA1/START domain
MLPAACEEVFDAWLDPEGMQQWMRPGPVVNCDVTLEPRVGGHFRIVMTAPNMKYVNTGEFRVLERPSKLEFTWVSPRWDFQETLVTIELFPRETRCELVLTHQRFPAGHSVPQLEKGWGEMLEKLSFFLPR